MGGLPTLWGKVQSFFPEPWGSYVSVHSSAHIDHVYISETRQLWFPVTSPPPLPLETLASCQAGGLVYRLWVHHISLGDHPPTEGSCCFWVISGEKESQSKKRIHAQPQALHESRFLLFVSLRLPRSHTHLPISTVELSSGFKRHIKFHISQETKSPS